MGIQYRGPVERLTKVLENAVARSNRRYMKVEDWAKEKKKLGSYLVIETSTYFERISSDQIREKTKNCCHLRLYWFHPEENGYRVDGSVWAGSDDKKLVYEHSFFEKGIVEDISQRSSLANRVSDRLLACQSEGKGVTYKWRDNESGTGSKRGREEK